MKVKERMEIVIEFLKSHPDKRFTNNQIREHIGNQIAYPEYMTRYPRHLHEKGQI